MRIMKNTLLLTNLDKPKYKKGVLSRDRSCLRWHDEQLIPIGFACRAKSLDCSSLAEWDDAMVDEGTGSEEKWKEDRVGENMVEH